MTTTMIDEVTEAVATALLRRGFVHDDAKAYRAGVRDAVDAVRDAMTQESSQQQSTSAVERVA